MKPGEGGLEAASGCSSPSTNPGDRTISVKRPPSTADGADSPPHKVTKRRAARACVSCRARKVRCDVVEGTPCGNCRWDNVEVRYTSMVGSRASLPVVACSLSSHATGLPG